MRLVLQHEGREVEITEDLTMAQIEGRTTGEILLDKVYFAFLDLDAPRAALTNEQRLDIAG